jgi:glycosyltransferase involved in cell wall biosynthesis
MTERPGVSFVVPVHNGRRWLPDVIDAIHAQAHGGPLEIIVVDDGGTDGSGRWLRRQAGPRSLTVVPGPGRGAAAAVNAGIRESRYPIVCQVDQDVIVQSGWLCGLLEALDDPDVAAAQGRYVPAADAGFWARVMGRDLEWRYARMRSRFSDHVCTGNTAYRASALHAVGLFDEDLGYGYDNDISYRLRDAGYRLAFCADAVSVHRWRDGAAGYLRQQFGVGYGRLDVVRKHPTRVRGDAVSNAAMMAHAPMTLVACLLLTIGALTTIAGNSVREPAYAGLAILALLTAERALAGIGAWKLTRDPVALGFPAAHLARNLAWGVAIIVWSARRIARRSPSPVHSMSRSQASMRHREYPGLLKNRGVPPEGPMLAVVPAYNEAENLARVVDELRRVAPAIDVLVVNDGSTDATPEILPSLGVSWLTMPARVGVGGAVRAGLRYAVQRGYRYVVRIDGDGQHRVSDMARLLAPVIADRLDAVVGSRFIGRRLGPPTLLGGARALLAVCLTAATGRRITDPTSGFCLLGPRALRLLARHHPTGYAEPELILLLHRNGLRVGEVPIRIRPRLKGRTSLTPVRALIACGRTLLALLVVPARRILPVDGSERS